VFGLKLKSIIVSYLRAPDTKLNPINSLIWMDQLNSICFGTVNLLFGAFAFVLVDPIRKSVGNSFCDWIPLFGCFSNVGSVIWFKFHYTFMLKKLDHFTNTFLYKTFQLLKYGL
jgi:hypothetical protein